MTAGPLLTARLARWLLALLHVAMVAPSVWYTAFGTPASPPLGSPVIVLAAATALVMVQLRLSFAAARLTRPRGWQVMYAAVLALAYVPYPWWAPAWVETSWCAMASSLMVLRGRLRIVVFGALALFAGSWHFAFYPPRTPGEFGISVLNGVIVPVPALVLYLATRLAHALEEAEANRAELAALAVTRERLRLSRELHDLLGQSLSAVSLKGELALRLLSTDPGAARREVAELTRLAEDTRHGMRAVTYDTHPVSLRAESDGAVALLRAAGLTVSVDLDVGDLSPAVDAMLGWAVREGVTNVLRHSDATCCRITVRRHDDSVHLEVLNDRAGPEPAGDAATGSGLAGLAARVQALGGSSWAGRAGDTFRLTIEIPQAMTNVITDR